MNRFCIFWLLLFLICPLLYSRAAEAYQPSVYYRSYSKYYLLSGDVGFAYDRRWTDSSEATDRFHHFYRLGLSGFVVDPRLMTFDLSSNFTQEVPNAGDTLNWYGVSGSFSFLNEQVRRGMLRHFPQPIQLRFAYSKSGEFDSLSYGISLRYKRPEHLRFFSDGKIVSMVTPLPRAYIDPNLNLNNANLNNNMNNNMNNNNNNNDDANLLNANNELLRQRAPRKFEITFPAFYFDYDRTTSTYAGRTYTSDYLSLRSEAYGANSQYKVEYLYQSTSGDAAFTYHRFTADADFKYDNKLKHQRFESYNRFLLLYSDNNDYLSYSTRNTWQKRLGASLRDSVYAAAVANIYSADSSLDHSVGFSGGYYKHFSERFNNAISFDLNVSNSGGKTIHSESISNTFNYQLLRTLLLTNTVTLGLTEAGADYAFSIGLSSRTRFPVTAAYSLQSSALSDGRRKEHLFSLDISGVLYRDIRFSTRNSYRFSDVEGDTSYNQKVLSLNADLFWRVSRFDISLGATHSTVRTSNGVNAKSGYTSIRATASTYLRKRLYLTVSSSFTSTEGGDSVFNVSPTLSWYIREVAVLASYEFYRMSGDTDSTDHRLYLRVSRHFERKLRPFL